MVTHSTWGSEDYIEMIDGVVISDVGDFFLHMIRPEEISTDWYVFKVGVMTFKELAIKTGATCPYCESNSIYSDSPLASRGDKQASRIISCTDCRSKWIEVLGIVDVEEVRND